MGGGGNLAGKKSEETEGVRIQLIEFFAGWGFEKNHSIPTYHRTLLPEPSNIPNLHPRCPHLLAITTQTPSPSPPLDLVSRRSPPPNAPRRS